MRNYTIPEHPIYDENIRMLENTDPADADSVFNPLFSKVINNVASVKKNADQVPDIIEKFHGITIKDTEILNIPNTRDYDYLSLELGGNTRVTPENPDLPISPENVANIKSVGENGKINILKSQKNLLRSNITFPNTRRGITIDYDETTGIMKISGNLEKTGVGSLFYAFWGYFGDNTVVFKKNSTYTFSIRKIKGTINDEGYFSIGIFSRNNGWIYETKIENNTTMKYVTKTYDKDIILWRIEFGISEGTELIEPIELQLQLENNAMPTEYEKPLPTISHANTLKSVLLKDTDKKTMEPLRNMTDNQGNLVAKDRIMKKNNIWGIERNIKFQLLNGSEQGWIQGSKGTTYIDYFINPLSNAAYPFQNIRSDTPFSVQSNKFSTTIPHRVYNCYSQFTSATGIVIGMPKDIDTVEKLRIWLSSNPVQTIYALQEPEWQPLHPDTQFLLNDLEQTCNSSTVITGMDEIAPLLTANYARGSLSTKQINGCEVNDTIIGDRNLLTASKTVELIHNAIAAKLNTIQ